VTLQNSAKHYGVPLVGVFSKDDLPRVPRQRGGHTTNTQNSNDSQGRPLPGTHWVALWIESDKEGVCWDSYGVTVPEGVKTFCKGVKVLYSTEQIQSLESRVCGYYVTFYLWKVHVDKSPLKTRFDNFIRVWSVDGSKNRAPVAGVPQIHAKSQTVKCEARFCR
jgi:hypothetical protein